MSVYWVFQRFLNGPTWSQAEATSVALGGNLVTINDVEENPFVGTSLRTENANGGIIWIGLNDADRDGNWTWSSGSNNSYLNWRATSELTWERHSGEDYAVSAFSETANWNPGWVSVTNNSEFYKNTFNWTHYGIAEIPLSYFSVSDLTLSEGSSGTVTITRTGGTRSTQNLTLTSSNGIATAGSDYTAVATTVRFAAGETSKTVSVGTIDDSAVESSETFNLTLTASSSDAVPAQISDGTAVVTITDNAANNGNIVVTGDGNTVGNTTVINNTTNNTDNSTTTNVTINNSSTSNNTTNNTNNITNNFSNVVGNITVDLSSLIQGVSSKSDAISGSAKDDALGAGKGADKLTGAGGADQFVFNTKDKFGKKGADTITDFNPEEEDQLVLSPDALPGLKTDPTLQSVTSKKALKAAQKSDSDLVYYQPLGQLFYDQNSTRKGFGKGGLFAVLLGAPAITAEDLAIF